MACGVGTEVGSFMVPRARIRVGPGAPRAPRTVAKPARAGARILEFDIVGSSSAPHRCGEEIMEVLHPRCAGLDVHCDSVVACARLVGPAGIEHQIETFGTTISELERLSCWLAGYRVTQVAMEATGVYWKPVWAVLLGKFELVLANAMHVKNVPGRKTDTNDAA